MALTTVAIASVAVGAYGAYNQKRAGDKMAGLGNQQARRQAYYDDQLRQLIEDPSKIYSDPGYLAAQGQGVQAIERAGTLSGFTGSGNAAIALQKFGQSFSMDYLRSQQQLLASMAGGNFNPASAMSASAGANSQAFAQLGSTLASLGYSMGGGGAGSGSSGGSAWGSDASVPGTMNIGGGYIVNVPGANTGATVPYSP